MSIHLQASLFLQHISRSICAKSTLYQFIGKQTVTLKLGQTICWHGRDEREPVSTWFKMASMTTTLLLIRPPLPHHRHPPPQVACSSPTRLPSSERSQGISVQYKNKLVSNCPCIYLSGLDGSLFDKYQIFVSDI